MGYGVSKHKQRLNTVCSHSYATQCLHNRSVVVGLIYVLEHVCHVCVHVLGHVLSPHNKSFERDTVVVVSLENKPRAVKYQPQML